jgi:chitin disaccharide deacetylase
VQLTLNAEFDLYRWGPITHAPSLVDGDGGFPRTPDELWEHADLDEVRRECRTQIERAIVWGFDVSHLDSHLGALHMRPEFFDVYLDLAVEFRLPIRLPGRCGSERAAGFPLRRLAADEGILFPDHLEVVGSGGVGSRKAIERACSSSNPASPRCMSTRRSTAPSCGPMHPTGPAGSTTCTSSPTTAAALADQAVTASSSSATARLRDAQRAG